MRGTEFHAEAAGLAALYNYCDVSFCHEIPQQGSNFTSQVGLDYGAGSLPEGVTAITLWRETEHKRNQNQQKQDEPKCSAGAPLRADQVSA